MTDWATISSLATAGGTLVLAVATFASVRSANASARVAERSLLVGLRPVLVAARPEDPPEHVKFYDHQIVVEGGAASVDQVEGRWYMAFPVRNVGSGIAVLHGWHVGLRDRAGSSDHADPDEFRPIQRDLYVPPGDTGYWQGALRDQGDPDRGALERATADGTPLQLEVLYGDHEGGQRTITRFGLVPAGDGTWSCNVLKHWRLDGADPR